jgi:Flp pilus assembly protein TadB
MTELVFLAYRHAYGYGGGWTDWIAHTALSSVIHALIYGLVFKLMHRLTLGEAVVLVVAVLVVVFMWSRSRNRRGW